MRLFEAGLGLVLWWIKVNVVSYTIPDLNTMAKPTRLFVCAPPILPTLIGFFSPYWKVPVSHEFSDDDGSVVVSFCVRRIVSTAFGALGRRVLVSQSMLPHFCEGAGAVPDERCVMFGDLYEKMKRVSTTR